MKTKPLTLLCEILPRPGRLHFLRLNSRFRTQVRSPSPTYVATLLVTYRTQSNFSALKLCLNSNKPNFIPLLPPSLYHRVSLALFFRIFSAVSTLRATRTGAIAMCGRGLVCGASGLLVIDVNGRGGWCAKQTDGRCATGGAYEPCEGAAHGERSGVRARGVW